VSAHLTIPNRYAIVRSRSNGSRSSSTSARAGLTCVAVKNVRRRGSGVEDAELVGDVRNRLRCVSSTDSQRRLAPRWSNAAVLPAGVAGVDEPERERGREAVWEVAGDEVSLSV
jgi:hypothetical protein